jgi:hypothetical protein
MSSNKNDLKGGVSSALKKRLGRDLAQMFETVGRKMYADLRDQVRDSIQEVLKEHKASLQGAVLEEFGRRGANQAEEHIPDFLNEILGDALYDTAVDIESDLEAIADALMEAEDSEDDDDDDDGDDVNININKDDDDDDEEEDEDEGKDKKGKGRKAQADDDLTNLAQVQANGIALAVKLANKGYFESASLIRVAMKDLQDEE